MRLLVTGGAGYVGSVATTLLLEAGHQVAVVDDLSTGHRDAVPAGASFHQIDILDAPALSAFVSGARPFDAILHLAALCLVGESGVEPARYFRHNVTSTANLLEAMRRYEIATIVFSSTAAVYGEPAELPMTEATPTHPTNAYGESKLAADRLLSCAAQAYGIGAVSLRYFNVAGAYGAVGERHAVETDLVPRLLAVAAGTEARAEIFGTDFPTPDGTAIRDYVHVRDIAEAHLLAFDAAAAGSHLICNLGTNAGSSVREVVTAVEEVTGRRVPVAELPRRPGDPARLVASGERARDRLGWIPKYPDIATMVADAWDYRGSGMQRTGNDGG